MTAHVLVDGIPITVLFPFADIKHSTAWETDKPSGDRLASVSVFCEPNFQPPWTLPGRRYEVRAHNGGITWGGLTVEPERTESGLTIHAQGIGVKLDEWPAVTFDEDREVTVPTFIPNEAVDYAEANGAPFSRYGVDLGDAPIGRPEDGGMISIGALLARAAVMLGQRVYVDSLGAVTFRSDPTEPTWTTTPDQVYMGNADEQCVTKLWGNYVVSGESQFFIQVPAATGGTFTLSGNGATTAAIAFNATIGTVQTQVQGLGGIFADATVQGSAGAWLVIVNAGGALLTGAESLTPAAARLNVSVNLAARVAAVEDTAAADKFGGHHASIDLTNLGAVTDTEASTYLAGRFELVGARMGWTEKVDLSSLNLMHITGAWAQANGPRAGDMLQIPGNMDARSNPTILSSIRFVLAEVEVTELDDPISVASPLGFTPRDFSGALAPPENPTTKEAA